MSFEEAPAPLKNLRNGLLVEDNLHKLYNLQELRTKYLLLEDPTEYYFAIKVIGSWLLWEEFIKNNTIFVESLRRELEAKIKSNALLSIIERSKGDTRDSLVASKYLVDTPWIKKSSKGRPSKESIDKEIKKLAEANNRITNDYKRLKENT